LGALSEEMRPMVGEQSWLRRHRLPRRGPQPLSTLKAHSISTIVDLRSEQKRGFGAGSRPDGLTTVRMQLDYIWASGTRRVYRRGGQPRPLRVRPKRTG